MKVERSEETRVHCAMADGQLKCQSVGRVLSVECQENVVSLSSDGSGGGGGSVGVATRPASSYATGILLMLPTFLVLQMPQCDERHLELLMYVPRSVSLFFSLSLSLSMVDSLLNLLTRSMF